MSEKPDFGEPWRVLPERGEEHFGDFTIWSRDGFVANVDDEPVGSPLLFDLSQERAERAAACVNACVGMADPETEIAGLRERDNAMAEEGIAIGKQRAFDAARVQIDEARTKQLQAEKRAVKAERERDEARAGERAALAEAHSTIAEAYAVQAEAREDIKALAMVAGGDPWPQRPEHGAAWQRIRERRLLEVSDDE